ncbi:unnamed protein product [Ectocarpus sp. 6 AP-2014]
MDDVGVDDHREGDTPTTRPVSHQAPRNTFSLGQTSSSGGRELAPVAEGPPVSLAAAAAAAPAALETAEALLSMSPSVRHRGGSLEHGRDGGAPPARPTSSVSRRDGDDVAVAAAGGGGGGGSKPPVPPAEEEEGGACDDPVGTPNSTASLSRRIGPGSPSSATGLLRTTRRAMPPPPPPASYRSPALARPPNASSSSSSSTPPSPGPLPSQTPPMAAAAAARRPATPSFKAGDLVSVPSRSSPGVNKEGGVAKVTLVRPDGTCDVKYIVHHGREKGVPAGIISFYALDDHDNDEESTSAGGGDGRREHGGRGRGAVAAGSSGSSSRSSTPASKEAPSSSRVRRTSRKGWCSPDLAAGQAYAACLSYMLGETQHPELDLDPDLGELLDPNEGSGSAGDGGGKVDESRRTEDGASPAAAAAATAAEEEAKEGDDDVTVVVSGRGVGSSGSSGGGGGQGSVKGVVGKRKRMARGGGVDDDDTTRDDGGDERQVSDDVEGGASQGQGCRRRRRRRRISSSANEASEGMEVFDISALSAGSNRGDNGMTLLTTALPLDPEGRGGGGGDSHDVFDITALSDETNSGDSAAVPLPAATVDSNSHGGGGGGSSGSRSRGRAAAPPTAAVRKRCRLPGSESAEVGGRPVTSGKGKSKTAKAGGSSGSSGGGGGGRSGVDGRGDGGGLQGACANGRRGLATSAAAVAAEEDGAVVLTMSGSSSEMSKLADSLAKSRGWRVEPKYTEAVTHVVCGTVPKTAKARVRSVKFLRAVAGGKWVVTEAWLQECRRRGCRAEEEAFEVAGDKKSHVPSAPTRSRLAHADVDRPGLFQGITFHFRGQFGTTGSPPLSDLESMLLANAGKVVSTLGSLCGARSNPLGSGSGGGGGSGGWRPRKVVIFQPSSPDEDQRALEEKKLAAALAAEAELSRQGSESAPRDGGGYGRDDDGVGVVVDVVRPIWLVDSVGCFRVLKPAVHHRVPGFGPE